MALDYVDIERTEEQLTHAIDFADDVEKTDLEHSINATENISEYQNGNFQAEISDSNSNKGNVIISSAETVGSGNIALGPFAYVKNPLSDTHYVSHGIAIGRSAYVKSDNGIALGYMSAIDTGADNSIQLGRGTNRTANTFKVFDTTILNANGKIPASSIEGGGGGGTSDYDDLDNKPSINSVTLSGNKSLADLGIQEELTAGQNVTINNNVISAGIEVVKI